MIKFHNRLYCVQLETPDNRGFRLSSQKYGKCYKNSVISGNCFHATTVSIDLVKNPVPSLSLMVFCVRYISHKAVWVKLQHITDCHSNSQACGCHAAFPVFEALVLWQFDSGHICNQRKSAISKYN